MFAVSLGLDYKFSFVYLARVMVMVIHNNALHINPVNHPNLQNSVVENRP